MSGEADFTFNVDPGSVDKCTSALDDLKQRMHVANSRATAAGIAAVQKRSKEAASGAPGPKVITGRLRDSIWVEGPDPDGDSRFSAKVGPTVIYGRIQELGGTIVPKFKKSLFWVGDDGQPHFAMRVTLPPRPYMRPGLLSAMPEIQDAYATEWGSATSSDYREGYAAPAPPPPPTAPTQRPSADTGLSKAEKVRSDEFKSWDQMSAEEREKSLKDTTPEEMRLYSERIKEKEARELAAFEHRRALPPRREPVAGRVGVPPFLLEHPYQYWDAYSQELAKFAERHPNSNFIRRLRAEDPKAASAVKRAAKQVRRPKAASAVKRAAKQVRRHIVRRIL